MTLFFMFLIWHVNLFSSLQTWLKWSMDSLGEYCFFCNFSTGQVFVQLLKILVNGKHPLNVLVLATLTWLRVFKKVTGLAVVQVSWQEQEKMILVKTLSFYIETMTVFFSLSNSKWKGKSLLGQRQDYTFHIISRSSWHHPFLKVR